MYKDLKELIDSLENAECRLDDILEEEKRLSGDMKQMLENYSQKLCEMRAEVAKIPSDIQYYEEDAACNRYQNQLDYYQYRQSI